VSSQVSLPHPIAGARPGRWRLGLWLALGAQCALLGSASVFGDFRVPGFAGRFVGLMAGASALFLVAIRLWTRMESPRRPMLFFWLAAIALRLAMLGCEPGDDIWRYLWEGRIQLHGENPYVLGPDALSLERLRDVDWPKINHPDYAAVYPPATELVFKAIAAVSPTVFAFKLVFVAADLLCLGLIVALCGGDLRGAAWYGWNPAVIYAFAGAGHYDSLMLLTMTASFLVLHRACTQGAPGWGAAFLSGGLLGMAIALKLVPAFLVPAWACALGKKSGALLIAALIPAALTLVFGGPDVVFAPLQLFADVARFNTVVWWLFEAVTWPFAHNDLFTLALAAAVLAAVYRFRTDWRRAALWSMGLVLLLSPVLHPWYLTWILPFACWRRAHAWSIFSLSALSSLVLWETTRFWVQWEPNPLTRLFLLVPPFLAWQIERRPPTTAHLPHPTFQ
jgi:alpha-1,6-mannosyltransferase